MRSEQNFRFVLQLCLIASSSGIPRSLLCAFIETEDIGKIGERKGYPVSPAASEPFCHKGLTVSLGFLVFAGAFDPRGSRQIWAPLHRGR